MDRVREVSKWVRQRGLEIAPDLAVSDGAHHNRTTPLATLKPGSRGLHALMTCQVAHFTDQEAIAMCGGLV